jgi:hypothetical protein
MGRDCASEASLSSVEIETSGKAFHAAGHSKALRLALPRTAAPRQTRMDSDRAGLWRNIRFLRVPQNLTNRRSCYKLAKVGKSPCAHF